MWRIRQERKRTQDNSYKSSVIVFIEEQNMFWYKRRLQLAKHGGTHAKINWGRKEGALLHYVVSSFFVRFGLVHIGVGRVSRRDLDVGWQTQCWHSFCGLAGVRATYRWPPSGFGALSGINRLKKRSSDETASPRKPTQTPLAVSVNEGAVALSTAVSGQREWIEGTWGQDHSSAVLVTPSESSASKRELSL